MATPLIASQGWATIFITMLGGKLYTTLGIVGAFIAKALG